MPWADIIANAGLWATELGIKVRDDDDWRRWSGAGVAPSTGDGCRSPG